MEASKSRPCFKVAGSAPRYGKTSTRSVGNASSVLWDYRFHGLALANSRPDSARPRLVGRPARNCRGPEVRPRGADGCIRLPRGWSGSTLGMPPLPAPGSPEAKRKKAIFDFLILLPFTISFLRDSTGAGDGAADAAGTDRQAGLPGDGLKPLRRLPVFTPRRSKAWRA
jgi:hypothetical protein